MKKESPKKSPKKLKTKPKRKKKTETVKCGPDEFCEEDLEELDSIINSTKNTHIRLALRPTLDELRNKFVTKILNKRLIEDQDEEQLPEKPNLPEFDRTEYFSSTIKGFKAKVRSLKEALSHIRTRKIKEVLIDCKGNEEKTMNCLLMGEKIPHRDVPKDVLASHEKKNQKSLAEYEERIKRITERSKKKIHVLEDIDSTTINVKKIDERVIHVQKLLNSYTQTASVMSSLHGNTMDDDDFEDEKDENKLYLPGEKQAIFNDEPRVFTFKSERTLSNEVNHIHFRMAESQFFRCCSTMNYKVTEVKYIVTPQLLRRFEIQKKEFANDGYHNQYLMFTNIQRTIKWIRINNFPSESFKRGRRFSCNVDYCNSYLNDTSGSEKEVLFSLVITGREKRKNITKNTYKKPYGYDSLVNANCNDVIVYSEDMVLPFYIVKYKYKTGKVQFNNSGTNEQVNLSEEWNTFEAKAKADKKMDEMKVFYQMQLLKKEKERKMGKIDPTKPDFFTQYYNKKAEKENKKFNLNMDNYNDDDGEIEPETPLSDADDFMTPTPTNDIDDGVFDSEENDGEFEGESEFEMEEGDLEGEEDNENED